MPPDASPSDDVDHQVVELSILAGRDLIARDRAGAFKLGAKVTSDPYVVCTMGTHQFTTSVMTKTLNPMWNSRCTWVVDDFDPEGAILLSIFDRDRGSLDDPMGQVRLTLQSLMLPGPSLRDVWYRVEPCRGCSDATGELQLRATVRSPLPGETPRAERGKLARLSPNQAREHEINWAASRVQRAASQRAASQRAASMAERIAQAGAAAQDAGRRASAAALATPRLVNRTADSAAAAIQRVARGRAARMRLDVRGSVAAVVGADWYTDPRPPQWDIEQRTPEGFWWSPVKGWAGAAEGRARRTKDPVDRGRGPPQEVAPTAEEAAALYPADGEAVGELFVEVLEARALPGDWLSKADAYALLVFEVHMHMHMRMPRA